MPPKKKTKTKAGPSEVAGKKGKVEEENNEKSGSDEESSEEEEEEESTDDEDRGRGKRKRRESKGFEPEDFTMASERAAAKAAVIVKGRGVKLGNIPAVKDAIEKVPTNSEDLPLAYTFVFSNRGLPTKKEMKVRLLEFSGYLPPLPKGKFNQEEVDADDEKHETKYATKAYKLNLAQLRRLCDFFQVDQSSEDDGKKSLTKDETVDRLLDFLGEPDESWVKAAETADDGKKKKKTNRSNAGTKTKKAATAAKRKSVSKKVQEDPFSLLKAHVKGDKPSDAALRQWVQAYVVCFDMDLATTKHAVQTASDKFGVDMAGRKKRIKEFLADEM